MRIHLSFLPGLAAAFILMFARIGTMIMLCWRCGSPSGLVTPITIAKRHNGCAAPVMNHLRPLMT